MYSNPLFCCNNICFWCSHLEFIYSCLSVLFLWILVHDNNGSNGFIVLFWLSDLLIMVFPTILQISLTYRVGEEITLLFLHSFLSHMSALSMTLWFDEKWNIFQFLLNSINDCIIGFEEALLLFLLVSYPIFLMI